MNNQINYKQVVDKLQSLIPNGTESRFYKIKLAEYYSNDKTIIIIELLDTDRNDGYNKYGLYHSELNDEVSNDKDLFEGCLESLKEVYDVIKWTMSSVIDSGYVMLNEMTIENKIMDNNFKIGDTVRIRSWEDMENEFGLDSNGDINCKVPNFIEEMRYLCGKKYIIEGIGLGSNISLSSREVYGWSITTDMIEKVE